MDFKNPEVLKDECREGREFGFSGKQAIHPAQIDTIQEMFLPDPKGKLMMKKVLYSDPIHDRSRASCKDSTRF